jgi:glycosyltransferase involved in cell wall biosynthesis
MRVLMVNKFYDLRGGTERMMFDLSAGLTERGHDVVPFATADPRNEPTPYARYFAPSRDYDAPNAFRLKLAVSMIHDREAAACLDRLLDAVNVDVAHLHNIYHQLSPSILWVLRRRGIPTVMTLHDYKLVCPVYRLFRDGHPCEECVGRRTPVGAGLHTCHRGSRAQSWLVALESTVHRWRRVYEKGVDLFVSPSEFLGGVVRRHGIEPPRLRVIVNAPRRRGPPAAADERAARPRVLYAGRLSFEKGVDVLVTAAREAPDVEVGIAGRGPLEAELQARAEGIPNVQFLGWLDADALRQELGRAWAVALPSVWYENAPLSLLEAYAAGRPVLASDRGGLPEMVEEEHSGRLVPAGDVTAWTRALRRVAAEPERLAAMGELARARLDRVYDFDDCVEAYLDAYRGVGAR